MPDSTDTLSRLRAGALAGIQRLDLSCGLTEFPSEIFALADSLQVLNLSDNLLDSLPDDLPRLHQLRVVFCSGNLFTALPAVLGRCPQLEMVGFKSNHIRNVPAAALPAQLRWLILTDNQLEALPAEIGDCSQLQKLMLAGNRLQELPPELARCQKLELLRLSANRMTTLPPWLADMPRLAWLAFGGNSGGNADGNGDGNARRNLDDAINQAQSEIPPASSTPIQWSRLSLQQTLGEGASGVIHQALLQGDLHNSIRANEPDVLAVALKLFKGVVTSDGWPHSELAACLAAGAHPHLIPVIGPLAGHPGGAQGLVMQLIPTSFSTLARPPSLQTCTRDVYPEDTLFSLQKIRLIARGVAHAVAHLHAQGLLHGDLYAHNLQCNADGFCMLGDMGAAWFLPEDASAAQALQRLEVRAFGCLLEELLAHCQDPTPIELAALRDRCLQAPEMRPLFAGIVKTLAESARWN